MRCLLLHADDDPVAGSWARGPWDRIVDFGIAGPATYDRWTKVLGCPVEASPELDREDFVQLREIHHLGLGYVVDREGLDWWDLTWLRWLDQFVETLRIAKFVSSLGSDDEVFVSFERYARVLDTLAPGRARQIRTQRRAKRSNALGRARRLKFSQVLEIVGDKYDGAYRWRRLIAPSMANCESPVVLLPSAYANASTIALKMAASLPEQQFLLVTTRQSANQNSLSSNVKRAQLASYAGSPTERGELNGLLTRWEGLLEKFPRNPALAALRGSGCFDKFPLFLREGLAIRNCWSRVFDREPVASVLCADEKNAYTRIPVLLARKRSLPTVACHHGALDGRYRFTDVCADQFVGKSEMEQDYMVKACRVPQAKVQASTQRAPNRTLGTRKQGDLIVFFSEPYELSKCRASAVYGEVMPSLARVATELGNELVIKLHPFESLRDRSQVLEQVLPDAYRKVVRFVDGPMSQTLIEQTRFCITIGSSAAVDCAMEGIPAFLCLWLDRYGFGYGEQYVKFKAALPLWAVEEIVEIPQQLEQADGSKVHSFSSNVRPELLRALLSAKQGEKNQLEEERLWA